MEHGGARHATEEAILEMDPLSSWGVITEISNEPIIWALHDFLTHKSISKIKIIPWSPRSVSEIRVCVSSLFWPALYPLALLTGIILHPGSCRNLGPWFLFKPCSGDLWIMWNLEIKYIYLTKLGCEGWKDTESNGNFYLKYFISHGPHCSRWKEPKFKDWSALSESWLPYL